MGGQFLLIYYGMAQADDCMEQNLPSLKWASRFPAVASHWPHHMLFGFLIAHAGSDALTAQTLNE
jgi:hypothetical protein